MKFFHDGPQIFAYKTYSPFDKSEIHWKVNNKSWGEKKTFRKEKLHSLSALEKSKLKKISNKVTISVTGGGNSKSRQTEAEAPESQREQQPNKKKRKLFLYPKFNWINQYQYKMLSYAAS